MPSKGGRDSLLDPVTIVGTAFGLAMDAFAVATVVAAGLNRITFRHIFRLAWHFGLFQAMMPVIGWFGGAAVSSLFTSFAYWVAAGLLAFIGIRMIWESFEHEQKGKSFDPTRGWSLVGLSVATSIDALAVGISVGLMKISIWIPALVIGLITMVLTSFGAWLGRTGGMIFGPWAERIGGVILILIGIRILI